MIDRYSFFSKLSLLSGFSPRALVRTIKGIPYFLTSLCKYRRLNQHPTFRIVFRNLFPILSDREEGAGIAGGHYFHQDLWAARKIYRRAPEEHIDIGSRVDGFISHLLVFMPVTIIDIRRLNSNITGMSFICDNATRLDQVGDDSVESLSSLHAAEHFGLGRYSDPVDPSACFEFMSAMQRVLRPGGTLYFSVPVGRERLEFNAHRVFGPQTILDCFSKLHLVSFAYVGDDGCLYENEKAELSTASQCEYACGLFEFTKSP